MDIPQGETVVIRFQTSIFDLLETADCSLHSVIQILTKQIRIKNEVVSIKENPTDEWDFSF